MTPLERLNSAPSYPVLIHEVGHLLVGLDLNLSEGGIEFVLNPCDEFARAHYNSTGATHQSRIMRALAGMYFQALMAPGSILEKSEKLCFSILNASLFQEYFYEIKHGQVPADVLTNRFKGDWNCAISVASAQSQHNSDKLLILESSLMQLRQMVDAHSLKTVAEALVADVQYWLTTDDVDVAYAPLIIYPINRARRIFTAQRTG